MISFLDNSSEAKAFEKKPKPETGSSENPKKDDELTESPVELEEVDIGGPQQQTRGRSSSPHMESDAEPRGERHISSEEKLRAFKKQSEERLLHIKRSREAKIGKKKPR